MKSQLVIVGAGAAGLMAAAAAAERGVRAVLIERKHRPGRKILLCGNNRCNLSSNLTVESLVQAYGEPVGEFLRPALNGFSPDMLRKWFGKNGLQVSVHKDGRIFPSSEKADDVLHAFTDLLRDNSFPVIYNSPVTGIRKSGEGLVVETDSMEIECENVLLATGGVSYPKTGSVGDGQKFARSLGHKVTPYRPGLVGFVVNERWLLDNDGASFMDTHLKILIKGKETAVTSGEILCNKWGLSGPAMVNASRIIARRDLRDYSFEIDLKPELTEEQLVDLLVQRLNKRGGKSRLNDLLLNAVLPRGLCDVFVSNVLRKYSGKPIVSGSSVHLNEIAHALKTWTLHPESTRPLKEAMVTVGGVALNDVNPETLESERCPHLYFAGEVMDVDGPTGGFNLHAAFATARLAVSSLRVTAGKILKKEPSREKRPYHGRRRGRRMNRRTR